ncbi:hypothetical protein GCM10009850_079750 [Nonomuraea monospora]|uniref:Transposase n=1 Tax=Nonomuraea monospora TaxID=568818 RepID=A0ABN3CSS4_9ACTN
MRALARRHHVTERTVKTALTNPEPPARKPLPRRPSAIDPVQHLLLRPDQALCPQPDDALTTQPSLSQIKGSMSQDTDEQPPSTLTAKP